MDSANELIPAAPPTGQEERTPEVLRFLHGLLQAAPDAAPTLPDLLGSLAGAFAAHSAGLAAPLEGVPVVRLHVQADGQPALMSQFPWDESGDFLGRVRQSAVGLSARTTDNAGWLCAAVWPPAATGWLLWLTADAERVWSAGEAAVLTLAGQTLARLADLEAHRAAWPKVLEHARMQRHLEQASAVTSRLAHDFGNNLTGVLGFAELGLAQLPGETLAARYLSEVRDAALRGAEWVSRLQLFARRRARTPWPTSLVPTLREEEVRVSPVWGNRVALRVDVPPTLPPVALDTEALRLVFAQLLDNAFESIHGTGTVTVTARPAELTAADCLELFGNARPGPCVEVTVADTGSGLMPDTRRRLFHELFFSTKPQHRGLGLMIVYGLLQTFQGGFLLDDRPEGGTLARMFLPVGQQPQQQTAPPTPRGPRLLVVDDDPMVVRLVATTLESAGYRVETCTNGTEALARHGAAAEPFQLVLSDIVMPQLTGFELAHKLLERQADVNVLFISSEMFTSRLRQDKALRAFDLLAKPFRPEALLQAVRRSLESPRSFG